MFTELLSKYSRSSEMYPIRNWLSTVTFFDWPKKVTKESPIEIETRESIISVRLIMFSSGIIRVEVISIVYWIANRTPLSISIRPCTNAKFLSKLRRIEHMRRQVASGIGRDPLATHESILTLSILNLWANFGSILKRVFRNDDICNCIEYEIVTFSPPREGGISDFEEKVTKVPTSRDEIDLLEMYPLLSRL